MSNSPILSRRTVVALLAMPFAVLAATAGCGGDPDQRKSGTLVKPVDFVEKAGEDAGKREDAAKKARTKK